MSLSAGTAGTTGSWYNTGEVTSLRAAVELVSPSTDGLALEMGCTKASAVCSFSSEGATSYSGANGEDTTGDAITPSVPIRSPALPQDGIGARDDAWVGDDTGSESKV